MSKRQTGKVYEQSIEITDPITGNRKRLRRITIKVTELYRERWTIETMFLELTEKTKLWAVNGYDILKSLNGRGAKINPPSLNGNASAYRQRIQRLACAKEIRVNEAIWINQL